MLQGAVPSIGTYNFVAEAPPSRFAGGHSCRVAVAHTLLNSFWPSTSPFSTRCWHRAYQYCALQLHDGEAPARPSVQPRSKSMAHRANEAIRGNIDGAVHGGENSVVYMRYQCCPKARKDGYYGQARHRRTYRLRPQWSRDAISQAPNTPVYSVSTGATMEFAVKKIESEPYEGD